MPSAALLSAKVRTELLPTDEDVRFYQEHGYWVGPVLFGADEVAELAEHQDRVYQGIHETGREPWRGGWKFKENRPNEIRKTDNSHWSDRTIRKAVLDATIGAMAAKLHGVDVVRLWHDQLLYKPSGGGQTGNVGWHQDYGYWRACKEPNLTTVTLAVNANTPENGVIESMPGSHKRGLLHASDFFNQDLDGMQKKIEAESGQELRTVPMTLQAGQVSFHHCLTIHGSRANMTETPRRSIAIHLMCGTVHRNINGKHMNTELVDLKDGDPFVGEHFPVLYEA
ncbi:MAG: phytanoyl-CoA dioxygenase family protein [Planctomycetota bacterium]|nr:phytanoyl-CoA dioxygenase family protein [Planctomycetota bacterium]